MLTSLDIDTHPFSILQAMISKELQKKILDAIKEIKEVMGVRSMREMYHQYIMQEKQTAYLEQIYDELQRTVFQLNQKKRVKYLVSSTHDAVT